MEFKNVLNHSCRYPAEIKGSSVVFFCSFLSGDPPDLQFSALASRKKFN